jgi:hypothetical protein
VEYGFTPKARQRTCSSVRGLDLMFVLRGNGMFICRGLWGIPTGLRPLLFQKISAFLQMAQDHGKTFGLDEGTAAFARLT